jgi:RimJ/RimL family protein N-acetyltransferase
MAFEPLTISHAAEPFRLWSDLDTVRFTNWARTPTPDACAERAEKVVAHYSKEPLHFGPYVIRMPDNRLVGMLGADLAGSSQGEYDVWHVPCREEWGKGMATRAVGGLMRRMRSSGRVGRATAGAVAGNIASIRVLERLGFARGGFEPGGFRRHLSKLDLFRYCCEFEGAG